MPHLDTRTAPFLEKVGSVMPGRGWGQPRGKTKTKARSVWKCHHPHRRTETSLGKVLPLLPPIPTSGAASMAWTGNRGKKAIWKSQKTYVPRLSIISRGFSLLSRPAPTQPACGTSKCFHRSRGKGAASSVIFCRKFHGPEGWDDTSQHSASQQGLSHKESTCRCRRRRFDPLVGKIL